MLPVRIKGGIDAPKVSVDIGELAKSAAANKLKDRLRKKFGLDEPEAGQELNNLPAGTAEPQTDSEQPS